MEAAAYPSSLHFTGRSQPMLIVTSDLPGPDLK
jgi:hypothetical protein